jgi:peptidoglycan/LPS O-acetylase OafA/YrhL
VTGMSGVSGVSGTRRQPRRRRPLIVPLLLGVSGWLVLGITCVGEFAAVRPAAVFAFTLTGPGVAVVRLFPLKELLERAVLAVAVSLSLATLAAEAAYIGHALAPGVVVVVLATVCTAAAVAELAGGVRRPR